MLRAGLCGMCGSYQWKKVSLTLVVYIWDPWAVMGHLDLFGGKEGL